MAKYDWILIKSEFVEGIDKDGELHFPTLEELCERHGASISTMKKRSADDKWVQEKNLYRTKVEQKVQDKKAIHTAGAAASFASKSLDAVNKAIDLIITKFKDQELTPHEIQKLTLSLKDSVQSGNLVFGEPTIIEKSEVEAKVKPVDPSKEFNRIMDNALEDVDQTSEK